MKKTCAVILAVLFLGVSFPQKSFGGAWTVPQFKVWMQVYTKGKVSEYDFDQKGKKDKKDKGGKSWSYEMEPSLEFGVTDWLNLLCSFSYAQMYYKEYDRPASWGPYSVKNNGVKDVKYGTKLRLLKDPFVASVQAKVFQYTGYDNPQAGGDVAGQPMLGRGDDALEIRALFGKRFDLPLIYRNWELPCYVGMETGYRWRNRDVANDIPFFIEAGFWPWKWFLLKGEIDGYRAHAGTGVAQSYAIWRVGGVFLIFGDSVFREKNLFNIEVQYGQTFWGKGGSSDTTTYGSVVDGAQEFVVKVQYQF